MTKRNSVDTGCNNQRSGRPRAVRRLMTLVLLMTVAPAWAIEIVATGDGSPGSFRFELVNSGNQRHEQVRVHVDSGSELICARPLIGGRGALAAGQRVSCGIRPATDRSQGVVVVSSLRADGERSMVRGQFSLKGAGAPAQGAVAVLAGSVHVDSDNDGVLDAGEDIDYHYTVVNLGNQALASLELGDLLGVVSCPATTLAAGGHMICERRYTITASDDAEGLVVNEVEVTGIAANGDPIEAVDVDVRFDKAGDAGIMVIKSPLLANDADASGDASEGDTIEYTFVIKNTDALQLTDVDLVEPDPSLIDGPITCQAQTLSGAAFVLGSGSLPSLDAVLCTASHVITAAEAAAGEARNVVEVYGQPPFGQPLFGTAASLVVIPAGAPQIQVTKSADVTIASPGGTVTYTVTVANVGTVAVRDLGIADPLPAGVAQFDWTCTGSGGAVCPTDAGSGALNETVPNLPVAGRLVYTVTATLSASPPNTVLNQVTVTPVDLVDCQPDGTPSPCRADVSVRIVAAIETLPVPLGGPWTLVFMSAVMILFGRRRLRSRKV